MVLFVCCLKTHLCERLNWIRVELLALYNQDAVSITVLMSFPAFSGPVFKNRNTRRPAKAPRLLLPFFLLLHLVIFLSGDYCRTTFPQQTGISQIVRAVMHSRSQKPGQFRISQRQKPAALSPWRVISALQNRQFLLLGCWCRFSFD